MHTTRESQPDDQESNPERESFPELLENAGGWGNLLKSGTRPLPKASEEYLKKILSVISDSENFRIEDYDCWWRARMHEKHQGARPFPPEEMGAPPAHKARGGRINAEGVACLYLGESKETTIAEIGNDSSQYACVAKFNVKGSLRIADLTVTGHLCSSVLSKHTIERHVFERFVFNVFSFGLKGISGDIESYMPMQYFSERLRSFGYDGIAYESVKTPKGHDLGASKRGISRLTGINLALFDPNNANICADSIEVVKVRPD